MYEEESSNTYCADDVYFLKDGKTYLPLDSSRVDDYLKTIRNLKLTDYVIYNVTAEELESYGLDQPKMTITVNYLLGGEEDAVQGTYTLSVSRSPEDKEKAADSEEAGEDFDAYVRIGDSQIIYQIASGDYEKMKNLDAVRFTGEQPEQKEEIHLVVYLDNENFPEVEIGLHRYDGNECLVVVDGEPVSFV